MFLRLGEAVLRSFQKLLLQHQIMHYQLRKVLYNDLFLSNYKIECSHESTNYRKHKNLFLFKILFSVKVEVFESQQCIINTDVHSYVHKIFVKNI